MAKHPLEDIKKSKIPVKGKGGKNLGVIRKKGKTPSSSEVREKMKKIVKAEESLKKIRERNIKNADDSFFNLMSKFVQDLMNSLLIE